MMAEYSEDLVKGNTCMHTHTHIHLIYKYIKQIMAYVRHC